MSSIAIAIGQKAGTLIAAREGGSDIGDFSAVGVFGMTAPRRA